MQCQAERCDPTDDDREYVHPANPAMGANEKGAEPGIELKSPCDQRNGSAYEMGERCDRPLRNEGTNERWAKPRCEQYGGGVSCDAARKQRHPQPGECFIVHPHTSLLVNVCASACSLGCNIAQCIS